MKRDMSRRALLGATAAAPVLAVAPAAISDTMSVLPAAGPLPTAFRDWRTVGDWLIKHDQDGIHLDDALYDRMVARERASLDVLCDAHATTAADVVVKLTHTLYELQDFYGIDYPDHPLPRTLESLKASVPLLPPDLAKAVEVAVENAERIARHSRDTTMARWDAEAALKDWKEWHRIFQARGAYAKAEEVRRANHHRRTDDDAATEAKLVKALREMPEERAEAWVNCVSLLILANHISFALSGIGEAHPDLADTYSKLIAKKIQPMPARQMEAADLGI